MYAFVRMLNAARRIAGRHSSAFYHSPMHVAINSPSVISVSKPPMLAVLSNTGSSGSVTYEISGSDSRYPPSTVLVDVFSSCRTTKTDITGAVSSTISNGHPSACLHLVRPTGQLIICSFTFRKMSSPGRGFAQIHRLPWRLEHPT
jgi:alpha-amylase